MSTQTQNQTHNVYSDNYKLFCKNINPSLQKELGINYHIDVTNTDWTPPNTYGLNNSERTIPEHYFSEKFKEIDMFYELTKDIRNLHPLTELQLNYIKTLPREKIIELLDLFNTCLHAINNIFERL